jgi:hypothetical protein
MNDQVAKQALGYQGGNALLGAIEVASTVRENIDQKILRAEMQVKRLKDTKEKLEKSGLLDISISDLQEAMRY